MRRTDLYNEQTGEILHPLLVEREEKSVLVVVVAGDKGFAGAFNSKSLRRRSDSSTSAAQKGQNIDLEPVGKKAIGFYKKKVCGGDLRAQGTALRQRPLRRTIEDMRHRAQPIEVAAEHPGPAAEGWTSMRCRRWRTRLLSATSGRRLTRSTSCYNEFKIGAAAPRRRPRALRRDGSDRGHGARDEGDRPGRGRSRCPWAARRWAAC